MATSKGASEPRSAVELRKRPVGEALAKVVGKKTKLGVAELAQVAAVANSYVDPGCDFYLRIDQAGAVPVKSYEESKWVTAEQVAAAFGCHVKTVRRLIASGELPSRKVGRRVYVPSWAITEGLK